MDRYRGKHAVILGLARQGIALARYLTQAGASVTVSDLRTAEQIGPAMQRLAGEPIRYVLGGHPLELLDGADHLCLSGGVPIDLPIVLEARRRDIPLSNDSQIFLEATPAAVIGITGSAGKTTTTTLVGRILIQADTPGGRTWVGGNIGNPLIADLGHMRPGDLAVMELSSFQLELMTRSPHVAAVLNLTPNHLDRHGTMEAYRAAKANILTHQAHDDVAVLGLDDPGARGLQPLVRGRLVGFSAQAEPGQALNGVAWSEGAFIRDEQVMTRVGGQEHSVCGLDAIRLPGAHNRLNVLAACALTAVAGAPAQAMRRAIEGFEGVEHRMEFVRKVRGARWINDSIATAPERAMAAMRAFDQPLVLLAGGRDKDLPWQDFAALVRERVEHLVLFGEAAPRIARAVGTPAPGERPHSIDTAATFSEAVAAAARVASSGDVVLLAPGGTSFDEFVDFAERGEVFKRLVREL